MDNARRPLLTYRAACLPLLHLVAVHGAASELRLLCPA